MRHAARRGLCVVALSLFPPAIARAQDAPAAGLWTIEAPAPLLEARAAAQPGATRVYRLNRDVLERLLAESPDEGTGAASRARISVPAPDGSLLVFRIEDSPVMAPELAQSFPGIDTFRGQAIDDGSASIRFDRTPLGFHATVVAGDSVFFVEPVQLGDVDRYVSRRAEGTLDDFTCLVEAFGPGGAGGGGAVPLGLTPSGTTLRRYRLAVAATGEYTQFFGSQALALAQITTTVNSVNAIYNVEIATHLILIGNENLIIYTDPSTDPFPLANKNTETQAAIDAAIGDGNYDIGHLFHRAGASISGNAGCIGCICATGSKGSGWSQGPNPGNSNFVFLAAHEMGHQHGANHTWNGPGCGAEVSPARYEPGSGTTIMSYSSICGADNIKGNQVGDLYFHAGSRTQIRAYVGAGTGSTCGTTLATGNGVPAISAGADYTIPRGTPFVLTAAGSDPDGETLTFGWEQYDLGNKAALNAVDDGTIPLFRSFPPIVSTSRTFPRFADLLAGAGSLFPNKLGEQLPSTDRAMNFRVTARDNRAGGGAADDDQMTITVSGDPFRITGPGAGGALECGASSPVTWDVGGGSVAPTVDILLSTDGGGAFPTVLAAGTANDGSQNVIAPQTLTGNARLRIDSVGNIFFALSPAISISDTLAPAIACPPDATAECTGNNAVSSGDPQLTAFFAGASASDACDASVAITNDAPASLGLGANTIAFTGTDDSGHSATCSAVVTVVDTGAPTLSVSVSPAELWAPNHTLQNIVAAVVVGDTCDPNPTVTLTSITSSEPDDGLGDGDTAGDVQEAAIGTNDVSFKLRAERAGGGPGRTYTITYTVTDGSGNSTSASATVFVPAHH